jgi:hypothetical protein
MVLCIGLELHSVGIPARGLGGSWFLAYTAQFLGRQVRSPMGCLVALSTNVSPKICWSSRRRSHRLLDRWIKSKSPTKNSSFVPGMRNSRRKSAAKKSIKGGGMR